MLNDKRSSQVIELCSQMIKCPSLSGHEEAMGRLVRDAMLRLGYHEVRVDRYGNVVGRISFSRPGKKILFEGHMDHVDVGDVSKWTVDPYGGIVRDGRIYGRGATDMKGSLAAMITAAAFLAEDLGTELKGEVLVAGSVHEECFEGVASREIGEQYRPDYVVIGEASALAIKRGQRGRAEVVVETYGKSAHSSSPSEGVNAVNKMVKLLSEVQRNYVPPEHPVLGKGILELTDIISFPYPGASVIPERCRVTFDRRLLVGETEEKVLAAIQEIIDKAAAEDPELKASVSIAVGEDKCYTGEPIRSKRFAPAWIFPEDHEFVTKAMEALRRCGITPRLSHYAFCTNGSYYAGVAGIPTIGFGPSREELAHVVDEYIEIDQLLGACAGYYAIARAVLE